MDWIEWTYASEETRERLRELRRAREQAAWLARETTAKLHAEVIAAQEMLPIAEIARLAGVSRRTVYDILEAAESDLD